MRSLGSFITIVLCICVTIGLYDESTHPFSTTTALFKGQNDSQLRSRSRKLLVMPQDIRTVVTKQENRRDTDTDTDSDQALISGGRALDPNVPSYVHLCRALLDRIDQDEITTPFVVYESEEVCHSSDSFQSLVTMMISTLVASVGTTANVSYRHKCATPPEIKRATIQQLLPEPLSVSNGMESDDIIGHCKDCLNQSGDMVECFGFPVLGKPSTPYQAAKLIPHFRQNIETAVRKVSQLDGVDRSAANLGVTIYLDTETELGVDVYQVPMKHYAEIIPRDIEMISIIVSEHCQKCRALSTLTKDYFHRMYPTAHIHLEFVGGSALAYERVMAASYYICSPSTFCLLPTLFKEPSHSSYLTDRPEVYPWLTFLAKSTEDQWQKSIFLLSNHPVQEVGDSLEAMHPFLFQPETYPNSKVCLKLRGRVGEWKQDMEYAKSAQYTKLLYQFSGFDFEPTPEMPYRLATTYRWSDDICPVQLMERQQFCNVMEQLGLTRIYFVGDSLAMQMVQSIWKLLGHEDEPYFMDKNTTYHRYDFNRTVECPNHQRGFEIVYTRNDMINNNDETDLPKRTGDVDYNCGETEFCMPWIRNFAQYQGGGTLLIANVGPHIHQVDLYRNLVDNFLGLMDSHQKPNDIVMFRTTPPGHQNCQDPNVAPIRSHDDYMEKHFIADYKSYQNFPLYNSFVEQGIRKRHRANLQVLDVVPMTLLRPDGHVSSPQNCKVCKTKMNDCLHYMLPGPPDHWNHLMFSNLVTMASAGTERIKSKPVLVGDNLLAPLPGIDVITM